MKHLKVFENQSEALNTKHETPFVSIIRGIKKVMYASQARFGDEVTIVDDEDNFIKGLVAEEEVLGPLCFTALETSTIKITQNGTPNASAGKVIQYSTDGSNWNTYTIDDTINLSTGDKVYFKSDDTKPMSDNRAYKQFEMSGKLAASGSIQSLMNNSTSVPEYCYYDMFYCCTSLTTAPALPATTLANGCYDEMFLGCTSLTTAPTLPATTLAEYCYDFMFQGCTSLTTAPALPATTLADYCYANMFSGCTSLTTAPTLPATTLANNCYYGMFRNCSNLNYIKAMFTTSPSTSYTNNWLSGVSSTGTFVKNTAATWSVSGASGIPTGWTVETA